MTGSKPVVPPLHISPLVKTGGCRRDRTYYASASFGVTARDHTFTVGHPLLIRRVGTLYIIASMAGTVVCANGKNLKLFLKTTHRHSVNPLTARYAL